jgi:hypothetical protein
MDLQAYLRPSAAHAWSKCRGYAKLCAAIKAVLSDEADNEVREDGVACHWLAKEVWDGGSPVAGSLSPNGRELTDEMFRSVAEYHALIRSWGACDPILEEKIAVSYVFPGVADGTPDVFAWNDAMTELFLADLKYGFRAVEVWRNPQLIIYAWTLVCLATKHGHAPQRVNLFIYQPRCAHREGYIRKWIVDIPTLGRLAEELGAAALECYSPNPMCTVNAACRDCEGNGHCETLKASAGWGAEVSYGATPLELTPNQIGYELAVMLQAQQRMEARINGLSTQAESLLKKGTRIPGFEMGRAGTRWRWRAGVDQLLPALGRMFGVDVRAPEKFKSVAQLRDKLPAEVVSMYAEKPLGELKLTMIDPNEATRKFEK